MSVWTEFDEDVRSRQRRVARMNRLGLVMAKRRKVLGLSCVVLVLLDLAGFVWLGHLIGWLR